MDLIERFELAAYMFRIYLLTLELDIAVVMAAADTTKGYFVGVATKVCMAY